MAAALSFPVVLVVVVVVVVFVVVVVVAVVVVVVVVVLVVAVVVVVVVVVGELAAKEQFSLGSKSNKNGLKLTNKDDLHPFRS